MEYGTGPERWWGRMEAWEPSASRDSERKIVSGLQNSEDAGLKWFDARPHPGPLPQGEGETLPVPWQDVALLIQGNRGESSDGKVNSTENSEEPNRKPETRLVNPGKPC